MRLVGEGQYTFEVGSRANKNEVAQAVARLFSVETESVRMINRRGKPKRSLRTRRVSYRPDRKFAVVALKEGQKIQGFEDLLKVESDNADEKV